MSSSFTTIYLSCLVIKCGCVHAAGCGSGSAAGCGCVCGAECGCGSAAGCGCGSALDVGVVVLLDGGVAVAISIVMGVLSFLPTEFTATTLMVHVVGTTV